MKHRIAFIAVWILAGCSLVASAVDYTPPVVEPNLVVDDQTTFLVDFSDGRANVKHADGSEAVQLKRPDFVTGGGLRGAFRLLPKDNLDPTEWTIETVCRVPGSLQGHPTFGTVEVPENYYIRFQFNGGSGVGYRAWGRHGLAGREHEFHFGAHAGGNGFQVRSSAPDQWVYVSMGLSMSERKGVSIARNMAGEVLERKMFFAGIGQLHDNFLKSIPKGRHAEVTEMSWRQMLASMKRAMPQVLELGHPQVEIRALRISKGWRSEVLEFDPSLGGPGVFTPKRIAPDRAQVEEVARRIGYPGHRNYVTVKVDESTLPLGKGDAPIEIPLKGLKRSLYSVFIHGSIDPRGREKLGRIWKPCPMHFEVKNAHGEVVGIGRRLLKQSFRPRRMQGFHVHIPEAGDYTVALRLTDRAQETARITRVVLEDRLADLPDEAIKSSQNLEQGKTGKRSRLTARRMQRDKLIWNALPPLNHHLQVHGQVKAFSNPPKGADVDPWQTQAFAGLKHYYKARHTFTPLDVVNLETKEVFPAEKINAFEPWPGQYPDDGTGVFFAKEDFPTLPHDIYYCRRAELLGERYLLFAGAILDPHGSFYGLNLAKKYFETGDIEAGHDAALALVRLAYDWPALEMNLHEIRLSTHSPDLEYNTDWSSSRNGKFFYRGWSGTNTIGLLTAYDRLYPFIEDNKAFAAAVHQFIPWVKTPEDVTGMLDRYLVFASVRDFNAGLIRAGAVEDIAAQVLGPHPLTAHMFDLTRARVSIYPMSGTYQEMYASALSRSGSYYIASFMVYAFGSAQQQIKKAYLTQLAREKGVEPKMDLSDVNRYPKIRAAGDFLIDMFLAGGFPFMVGDASGGTHTGIEWPRRAGMAKNASEQAVTLWKDKRHAWILKNMHGSDDPEIATLAEGVQDPVLHNTSRVVPDYGAILEMEPETTDLTRKTSATLRLGIGQGHSHSDYLDLNLFAMGLPMAVDLACRDEGGHWSRPGAGWSFLHNHAIAHDGENPRGAGNQSGEPWLRSFAPPLLRGSYVNRDGSHRLDRDVLLMEIGDTGDYYAFDVQRLRGDKLHTWCFHGCESEDLKLNVAMHDNTVRWIDRTLPGTHKTGHAVDLLQATWTMTRTAGEYPHQFKGGGVVKTVPCEETVLKRIDAWDPAQPEVHVRATLLGRGGDTVLQGNPYSAMYSYCFPFLWVQSQAGDGPSVYPAVYEWYRGDTPALSRFEQVRKDPLTVRVTARNGQVDTFEAAEAGFSVVSRDARGVRWAQLNGGRALTAEGIQLSVPFERYAVTITEMDHFERRIVTDAELPKDPVVSIGNDGRRSVLALTGEGTRFTYDDALLIHEGALTELRVVDDETIAFETNQRVLFGNQGNRDERFLTRTNEAATWQFRNGKVVAKPAGGTLGKEVFADTNNDGFVNLKTWEAGVGDTIEIYANVIVRRTDAGYEVLTNVPVTGRIDGRDVLLKPSTEWQAVQ